MISNQYAFHNYKDKKFLTQNLCKSYMQDRKHTTALFLTIFKAMFVKEKKY